MVQKVNSKFNELFLNYSHILEYADENPDAIFKERPVYTKTGGRSVPLTDSEFITLFKENCKNYNKESLPLYRGVNREVSSNVEKLGFIDPTKTHRVPSETYVFSQWFMDNDVNWADKAKRSKSVITSTSRGSACAYASFDKTLNVKKVYTVIPYDDVKISYVKHSRGEDLWYAFQKLPIKPHSFSIPDLNRVTNLFLVDNKLHTSVTEQNFIRIIKTIGCDQILELNDKIEKDNGYISNLQTNNKNAYISSSAWASLIRIAGYIKETPGLVLLYDLFTHYLDPDIIGVESPMNFTKELDMRDTECWVEGPCLLFLGDSDLLWHFFEDRESPPTFESTYNKLLYSAESIAGVISMDHL